MEEPVDGESETTVLVVEDERSFIDALSRGCGVRASRPGGRDGAQALDLFDGREPRSRAPRRDAAEAVGHRRVPPVAQRSQVPIIW